MRYCSDAPEVQVQGAIAQRFELLIIFVVADADNGDLAGLDGVDQLADASSVAARHAIHLIHDQADLWITSD